MNSKGWAKLPAASLFAPIGLIPLALQETSLESSTPFQWPGLDQSQAAVGLQRSPKSLNDTFAFAQSSIQSFCRVGCFS